MDLHVFETPEQVALAAADAVDTAIAAAGDGFTLGLAGGSTPVAAYRVLRERSPGWHRVTGWMTDERWVPLDHERCNGRMAAETLFDHIDGTLLRPKWSAETDAEESASHYENDLKALFADDRPDVVLLGMGADGHTASLFPGTRALEERDRWFVAEMIHSQSEVRLTATLPLLWRARRIIVLATGGSKAVALRESFEGHTPAGQLGKGQARVDWYVDRNAASTVS